MADTSDAAAYELLKRIAEKAVEPMSDESDPNKTIGALRAEMVELLGEAVDFVARRNDAARPVSEAKET